MGVFTNDKVFKYRGPSMPMKAVHLAPMLKKRLPSLLLLSRSGARISEYILLLSLLQQNQGIQLLFSELMGHRFGESDVRRKPAC